MALPAGRRRPNKSNASHINNNDQATPRNTLSQEQSSMMSMKQAEQVMHAALKMQNGGSGMTNMHAPPKVSEAGESYSHNHPQDRSPEHDLNGRPKKASRISKQKAQASIKNMVETEDNIGQHHDEDEEYNSEDGEGNRSDAPIEEHQDQEDGNQDRDEDTQEDEEQEEEPDWDSIAQHEPAKIDVPVFLAARDRRDGADERFAAMLDECHKSLHQSVDDLLNTAADIHNIQRDKLDALEMQLKHDFVCNEEARANMQRRLEESATAAQGLFAQLLMRVSQPLFAAAGNANSMAGQRPATASAVPKNYSRKRSASRKSRVINKNN